MASSSTSNPIASAVLEFWESNREEFTYKYFSKSDFFGTNPDAHDDYGAHFLPRFLKNVDKMNLDSSSNPFEDRLAMKLGFAKPPVSENNKQPLYNSRLLAENKKQRRDSRSRSRRRQRSRSRDSRDDSRGRGTKNDGNNNNKSKKSFNVQVDELIRKSLNTIFL